MLECLRRLVVQVRIVLELRILLVPDLSDHMGCLVRHFRSRLCSNMSASCILPHLNSPPVKTSAQVLASGVIERSEVCLTRCWWLWKGRTNPYCAMMLAVFTMIDMRKAVRRTTDLVHVEIQRTLNDAIQQGGKQRNNIHSSSPSRHLNSLPDARVTTAQPPISSSNPSKYPGL